LLIYLVSPVGVTTNAHSVTTSGSVTAEGVVEGMVGAIAVVVFQ